MGACPSHADVASSLGVCSTKSFVVEGSRSSQHHSSSPGLHWRGTVLSSENGISVLYDADGYGDDQPIDPAATEEVPTWDATRAEAASSGSQKPFSNSDCTYSPSLSPSPSSPMSPVRTVLSENEDFALELRGLSAPEVRTRLQRLVRHWVAKAKDGIVVTFGGARMLAVYDKHLQCLDLGEIGVLYPLATLADCRHISFPGSGRNLGLEVYCHGQEEPIVFSFERGADRAAMVLALHALASEAQQDKWHESSSDCQDDETVAVSEGTSSDSTGSPALEV